MLVQSVRVTRSGWHFREIATRQNHLKEKGQENENKGQAFDCYGTLGSWVFATGVRRRKMRVNFNQSRAKMAPARASRTVGASRRTGIGFSL
jgi:hypothetical protein